MTEQEAREIAVQAWCSDATKEIVMIPELALEFARILKREVEATEDRIRIALPRGGYF